MRVNRVFFLMTFFPFSMTIFLSFLLFVFMLLLNAVFMSVPEIMPERTGFFVFAVSGTVRPLLS